MRTVEPPPFNHCSVQVDPHTDTETIDRRSVAAPRSTLPPKPTPVTHRSLSTAFSLSTRRPAATGITFSLHVSHASAPLPVGDNAMAVGVGVGVSPVGCVLIGG